jgi:hypothetical protein
MSKNPFRDPNAKPKPQKRWVVYGETEVEVVAADPESAIQAALDQMRDGMADHDLNAREDVEVPDEYFGPNEWRDAIERTGYGDSFDSVTADGWLTDKRTALRLPSGFKTTAEKTTWRVDEKITGATLAIVTPSHRSEGCVRLGVPWVDERYLWLACELFGDLVWRSEGSVDPVVGYLGPLAVAVVMPKMIDGRNAEPFEACT